MIQQVFLSISIEELRELVRDSVKDVINQNPQNELMRADEAAEYLKISKLSIYGLVNRRKIPFSKRGKYLYFFRNDLAKWVKSELTIQQTEEGYNSKLANQLK